ncbi:hypothetical protein GPOL_c31500 [Gordonia polyisoprenivorans VH2]|uniref:Asp23/Gls24 family envelope stress response protein n=1 Tax=Gordonia polyisoprenivorans (strain DSM 44266 / VH2) TaxID=1112204 RepID=H6MWG0_GORPV|nr:hypothetical protein [Gordonia polyisoprenivorans]AFA74165.1 hypothetical protein GPOL_c31500 [Gordonia polyisoprenivorans VH2]
MIAVQAESGSDRIPTRSGEPGADLAQQVADAVTAVDGVTGLHGGVFGEIATYLPGGRVSGVQLDDDRGGVHVIVDISHDLRTVAANAVAVATEVAGVPVDVTVEDISFPGQRAEQAPEQQNSGTRRGTPAGDDTPGATDGKHNG